ncbi:MAG: hypothetical protein M0R51_12770 [Clostridia bacterium]|jgi:hypothetical protein|nr:hypothetical protein [Clostridia bacterium]
METIKLNDILNITWSSQLIEVFILEEKNGKNNVVILYRGENNKSVDMLVKEHGMRRVVWQYARGDVLVIKVG